MSEPVRCAHCGREYDLGTVTVVARYTDCTVWNAPCCGRTVDDRGETGWKSTKDYHRISAHEHGSEQFHTDECGFVYWRAQCR